jgi:excisionase family DNA binding protein
VGANPKGFLLMPRRKNKWLEKEKEPVAAIPVPVIAPITPQYLNIEQASAYLSVTTWTIRRLIDNKELSCAKIGKRFIVKREDLDSIWEKKAEAACDLVARTGIEPVLFALKGQCVNQLHYRATI